MNDDLPDLPPWRPIPPHVRARLRAEFDEGVERPRRDRSASAAAVAVLIALVAGVVVVLRHVAQDTSDAGAPLPIDVADVETALDRCWTAVERTGAADRYPDRGRWTPYLSVGDGELYAVAARAEGRALFCQTTPTTATVSEPTAEALVSREGVVAGTTTTRADVLTVRGEGPHGDFQVAGEVADGMFVALTGTNPNGTVITAEDAPVSGPPGLTVRDRPDGDEPDRASENGRLLGECLRDASKPVLDPDSYQPGASAGGVVLGRSATRLVVCRPVPGTGVAHARSRTLPNGGIPVRTTFSEPLAHGGWVLGGLAPAQAVRLVVEVDGGPPAEGPVVLGTFAVVLPPGTDLVPHETTMRLAAFDAAGTALFDHVLPYAL